MTVAINPVQKKESDFDKILKGLSAAKSITGIASDYTLLKNYYDQKSDAENNVVSSADMLKSGKDYTYSDVETPGAIKFNIKGTDGALTPKYATARNPGKAIDQSQFASLLIKGAKEVPTGTPGSILISHTSPDGSIQQSALLPPERTQDKPTGDQSKAALFGKRMEQAETVFQDLERKGFNAADVTNRVQDFSLFPEVAKSAQVKQQQQAERNFINAVLRRESGAAISADEFESGAKQYFPRIGDPPEVLKQKRENRLLAIEALKQESGPAYAKINLDRVKSTVENKNSKSGSSLIPEAVASNGITKEDLEAFRWAKNNPKDPRASKILHSLSPKGLR